MTEEKILKEKEIWEELGKKEKRAQILARLGEGGVIIVDLEHTYIESKVRIGNFVAIESFSKIERAEIEDYATIRSHSKVAEGSRLRKGCKIGPQACLRPGTIVEEGIDIGKTYV